MLQRQILDLMLREQSMLSDLTHTSYRIEGKIEMLSRRVDRIEDREHLRETTGHKEPSQKWSPRDYLLAISGAGLIAAAVLDKIPWSTVQSFVSALE